MTEFELIRQQLDERLAPPHTLRIERDRIAQAAVSIILHNHDGIARLLIIKRAERHGDPWSGHLALPGGKTEDLDQDLLATAARETMEEIGLDLRNDGHFIGQLPLIAPANPLLPQIEISPFVAIAHQSVELQLSEEVDAAFWIRISQLKRDGPAAEYKLRYKDVFIKRPAYQSERGLIWGITEVILTNFLSLLD